MSETQAAKARPDLLKWAMICAALVGVAAVLYVIGAASIKPKDRAELGDLARGPLAALEVSAAPAPAPDMVFADGAGNPVRLADFKGEVVVVNLWFRRCTPCLTEMPTLARLQAVYAAQPVKVVAITIDNDANIGEARAFLAAHPPLKLYRDPSQKMAFGMQPAIKGFPTTLIYDRRGYERARLSGGADWSSPQARELVERLLAER